ncbi:MAG TPA: hypothetical protein VK907_12110, partial [Phnomibacter sp.]|nr:hypothetical protein [Phnomibacter sp.]
IYRSVLRLHGIDSATFYRSLSYYQEDIERFRILMDSTYAYGIREREHWTLVKEAEQERLNALADTARTDTIKPGGMPADSVRADTIRPDTGKLLPVN